MKFKTTAKAIRNNSINPRTAGYCDLQYLLRFHAPIAYTCGVYGWNFDVYEVHGVTICTGYRGMVGARAEGIREYEDKAREIIHSRLIVNCDNKTFDEVLNEYISYNCNSETGKYPAFYIPTRMIDRFTNHKPTSETLGIINAYDYRYLERA